MSYNWEDLLTRYNEFFLKDGKILNDFFHTSEKPITLINKPASLYEISELEKRLSITLPPSYKQFLLVSNGFKIINQLFGDLLPADKVQRLIDYDSNFVNIWGRDDFDISDEMYFYYGEDQRTEYIRRHYLKECIAISGWFDGAIILLNPIIKYGEECEAWAFANWYPGAARHQSFWDLMNEGFQDYLSLRNK
jgi:hypothetical protein